MASPLGIVRREKNVQILAGAGGKKNERREADLEPARDARHSERNGERGEKQGGKTKQRKF